jgi:hypothetical protein
MQGNIHDCVLQIILAMSLMYSPYILWLLSGTLLEYSFSCRRPSLDSLATLIRRHASRDSWCHCHTKDICICICRGYNSVGLQVGTMSVHDDIGYYAHHCFVGFICRPVVSSFIFLMNPIYSTLSHAENHPTPRAHLSGLTHELFDASQSLLTRLRKVL